MKKKKKKKDGSKKTVTPEAMVIKCLARLLANESDFDPAYDKLLANLRPAVRTVWGPRRLRLVVLDPIEEALGKLTENARAVTEAIATNDDIIDALNAMNADHKASQRAAEAPVVANAPVEDTTSEAKDEVEVEE